MSQDVQGSYPPLNTLKAIADNLWIVDGPITYFGMPWPKMPFPTRMTVVRVAGDKLFIHSPTLLTAELRTEIEALGAPCWIIGPSLLHFWWLPDWKDAFPQVAVYMAPRLREKSGGRITFDGRPLNAENGYPWDAEIATLPIAGSYLTEVEFFHYTSRTLVLTDFIENFEPRKIHSFAMRWLTWLGGVQDPDGQMPRDMRFTFARQKKQLRAAVEKMIAWNPERIIFAHGRWYEANGAAELRRAFRWLLR